MMSKSCEGGGENHEENKMENNILDRIYFYSDVRVLWMCRSISLPDGPRSKNRSSTTCLHFVSF